MAVGVAILMTGCFGDGSDTRQPVSGDPEAARRADQRVGASGDQSRDGERDASKTLYQRLGGEAGIREIVDDMTARVIADPRVNFERRNVESAWGRNYKPWASTPENVDRFKQRMVEFLTVVSGGAPVYSGRDMKSVHDGMRITNSEFDAMVGDVKTSMDRLNIGRREQREVLEQFESTRDQIVEVR